MSDQLAEQTITAGSEIVTVVFKYLSGRQAVCLRGITGTSAPHAVVWPDIEEQEARQLWV